MTIDRDALTAAIDALKPVMAAAFKDASEAKRRLWNARDDVERARRLLVEAEVGLIAAERDYDDNGQLMQAVWADLKAQLLKIPADRGEPE